SLVRCAIRIALERLDDKKGRGIKLRPILLLQKCSDEFGQLNFEPSSYVDKSGKMCYTDKTGALL
ncbi:MAG: hypothetical protein ACLTAF_17845, partial [Blautia coccoides]